MWKGLKDRKNKLDIKRYCVLGLGQSNLINSLNRGGVNIKKIRYVSNKKMYLDICQFDSKKFFAITEELCYNIKKVKDVGIFMPLHYFFENIGLALGIIFFVAFSIFSNNFVFNIVFSDKDGSEEQNVKAFLTENGIKPFCKFSDFELKTLSSKILMNNNNLVYAGAKRKGNTLIIEIVKNSDIILKQDSTLKSLVSDVEGTVRHVRVYRGTALVSSGDMVKVGDTLVDGYDVVRDNKVMVNVIASVTIYFEQRFDIVLDSDNLDDVAEAIVLARYDEGEIASTKIVKSKLSEGYNYSVYVGLIRVITN